MLCYLVVYIVNMTSIWIIEFNLDLTDQSDPDEHVAEQVLKSVAAPLIELRLATSSHLIF